MEEIKKENMEKINETKDNIVKNTQSNTTGRISLLERLKQYREHDLQKKQNSIFNQNIKSNNDELSLRIRKLENENKFNNFKNNVKFDVGDDEDYKNIYSLSGGDFEKAKTLAKKYKLIKTEEVNTKQVDNHLSDNNTYTNNSPTSTIKEVPQTNNGGGIDSPIQIRGWKK